MLLFGLWQRIQFMIWVKEQNIDMSVCAEHKIYTGASGIGSSVCPCITRVIQSEMIYYLVSIHRLWQYTADCLADISFQLASVKVM